MGANRASAQVAATGVGEGVFFKNMTKRTEEHQNAPGFVGGFGVNFLEVEFFGRSKFKIIAAPFGAHAQTFQNFDDAENFFNAGHAAQSGFALV